MEDEQTKAQEQEKVEEHAINSTAGPNGAARYKATGTANRKIGSNDGITWFDLQTGELAFDLVLPGSTGETILENTEQAIEEHPIAAFHKNWQLWKQALDEILESMRVSHQRNRNFDWLDLADKFTDLSGQKSRLMLTCVGADIEEHLGGTEKAKYESLARKAETALGYYNEDLQAWHILLILNSPHFHKGGHHPGGRIDFLCEASADYCEELGKAYPLRRKNAKGLLENSGDPMYLTPLRAKSISDSTASEFWLFVRDLVGHAVRQYGFCEGLDVQFTYESIKTQLQSKTPDLTEEQWGMNYVERYINVRNLLTLWEEFKKGFKQPNHFTADYCYTMLSKETTSNQNAEALSKAIQKSLSAIQPLDKSALSEFIAIKIFADHLGIKSSSASRFVLRNKNNFPKKRPGFVHRDDAWPYIERARFRKKPTQ